MHERILQKKALHHECAVCLRCCSNVLEDLITLSSIEARDVIECHQVILATD